MNNNEIKARIAGIFLILLVCFLIVTGGCDRAGKTASSMAPNVILVSLDTLRADHLHCYGYDKETSPTIDTLAKEGVLFERAFAQSNWTLPSHVSMLSSLYPSSHGVTSRNKKISMNTILLAQILKKDGYRTASFNAGGNVSAKYGFSKGFDLWEEIPIDRGNMASLCNRMLSWIERNHKQKFFIFFHTYEIHRPYRAPDEYKKAYVHLEGVAREMKKSIFYKIIHDEPLTMEEINFLMSLRICTLKVKGIRKEFLKIYKQYKADTDPEERVSAPKLIKKFKRALKVTKKQVRDIYDRWHALKHEAFGYSYIIENYDAEIIFADHQIRRLVQFLEKMDLKEKTLLIITSDHGEEFLDHRNFDHSLTCYNEVMHVPLILYYPGRLPAGLRLRENAALIDLVPTIHELLGIPRSEHFQGVSLMTFIRGKEGARRLIFCEHLESKRAPGYKPVAVIDGEWKYHCNLERIQLKNSNDPRWHWGPNRKIYLGFTKPQELYHVDRDFREHIDLCKEAPMIVQRLSDIVEKHLVEFTSGDLEHVVLDKDLENQLRDLGYIE